MDSEHQRLRVLAQLSLLVPDHIGSPPLRDFAFRRNDRSDGSVPAGLDFPGRRPARL